MSNINGISVSEIYQQTRLIASETSSIESRERKRSTDAQRHFEHAIECLLKDLWLGTVIHPEYEVGIYRRSNWYSETPQYRDSNLTFKQAIAAYDGMVATDLTRSRSKSLGSPFLGRFHAISVVFYWVLFSPVQHGCVSQKALKG